MTASPASTVSDIRCPHCAYPASAREKICARCGHGLPHSDGSVWPWVGLVAALGLGVVMAMRSRNR